MNTSSHLVEKHHKVSRIQTLAPDWVTANVQTRLANYRGEGVADQVVIELTRLRLLITGQSEVGGEIHCFGRVEPPDSKLPVGKRQPPPEAYILTALVPALADLTRSSQVSRVVQVAQNLKDHLSSQSVISLFLTFLSLLSSLFSLSHFSAFLFLISLFFFLSFSHFFLSFFLFSLFLFLSFIYFFLSINILLFLF